MKLSSFKGATLVAATLFATYVSATLDLTKKNNMVLYWGQNAHGSYKPDDALQQDRLLTYCQDTNVDVISIGFVKNFTTTGTQDGWPETNFSNQCWRTFPDTLVNNCTDTIGADILACQKTYGKKILISIGGGTNTYAGFTWQADARAFATKIWDMFGNGKGPGSELRPFGDAVVDGVDMDIETLPATNYQYFAKQMRAYFDADTSKKFYLTAAPQCPNPDASLNQALKDVVFDMIFVQFYNNPACAADKWVAGKDQSTNSVFNFGMWHDWVASTSKNKSLKIFLMLPASPNVAGSGYVSRGVAANIVKELAAKYSSFAGAALWDASEVWVNTGFLKEFKAALDKVAGVTVAAKRAISFRA
ncbi:putative class III chitinase [Geopyxis carbonaria]|nr:putative class III chitinase [Geopyxis carbonaria]